ncbi:hypothetical protein COU39_01170 [Candidatus Micrarchaeota archaeon CG10_big_fil_rev_8_21_14_0_10_60_32]|nr:MAG: hypothetical protein AUJ16_03040 [Candidatus Micrarchaeota archaeon CG1_02_60_51]PIN96449.1 MAG: hypothetical protein COU39_01170 [Candidatus Micrarchaeota archaeon CG10_big_fil_rev_8_21_14_0_10_60_32]
MAGNKCECNCKMMLAGIAIAGLIIGGLAGYWYADSKSTEYFAKGAAVGCVSACQDDACVQSCAENVKALGGSAEDNYLPKVGVGFGRMCCRTGLCGCSA